MHYIRLLCGVYSSRPQYLFCVSLWGTPEGMTKGNLLPLYADSAFAVIQKPFLLLVHTRLPCAVSGLTPCLDHLNNLPTKEFTALPARVVSWKDTHRYAVQFRHRIRKIYFVLGRKRPRLLPPILLLLAQSWKGIIWKAVRTKKRWEDAETTSRSQQKRGFSLDVLFCLLH